MLHYYIWSFVCEINDLNKNTFPLITEIKTEVKMAVKHVLQMIFLWKYFFVSLMGEHDFVALLKFIQPDILTWCVILPWIQNRNFFYSIRFYWKYLRNFFNIKYFILKWVFYN
jgi:hypothetical protein